MRQTECLVVNFITVDDFAAHFNCTPAGQTSLSNVICFTTKHTVCGITFMLYPVRSNAIDIDFVLHVGIKEVLIRNLITNRDIMSNDTKPTRDVIFSLFLRSNLLMSPVLHSKSEKFTSQDHLHQTDRLLPV